MRGAIFDALNIGVMQVAQDADRETVKAAWRTKCLATHPDKVGAHAEGANEAVSAVKNVRSHLRM